MSSSQSTISQVTPLEGGKIAHFCFISFSFLLCFFMITYLPYPFFHLRPHPPPPLPPCCLGPFLMPLNTANAASQMTFVCTVHPKICPLRLGSGKIKAVPENCTVFVPNHSVHPASFYLFLCQHFKYQRSLLWNLVSYSKDCFFKCLRCKLLQQLTVLFPSGMSSSP